MPQGTKAAPGALTQEVAGILRGELARQKMTKTELAQRTQISLPQISNILAGHKHIDLEQFDVLCAALGLDADSEFVAASRLSAARRLRG